MVTSPNSYNCDLNNLRGIVENYKLEGNVVEFGTFSCESAIHLSRMFPNRTIFTIDHFEGLEQTKKNLPRSADWSEGMFSLNHPLFKDNSRVPKNKEEALKKLEPYKNVKMIISDVHKLEHPSTYGINKIGLVNIDVDIYEPTVSSLEFVSKCEWSELYMRFDDWHGRNPDFDQHERQAFIEWVSKYKYQFDITHGGAIGGVYLKR